MMGKNKPAPDDHFLYKYRYLLMAVILVFTAILSVTYWQITWIRNNQDEQTSVLRSATTFSLQIHYDEMEALEGNENDINKTEYEHLKSHINGLVTVPNKIKAAYLLKEVDAEIIYLVDYLSPQANDFITPGVVFVDAPEKFSVAYTTKEAVMVMSLLDRGKKWNSAIAPIINEDTNEVVGLLRLDYDINDWNLGLLSRLVPDLIISLLFFCFVIISFRSLFHYYQAKTVRNKYELTATLYRSIFEQAVVGIAVVEDKRFVSKSKFGDNNMNPMFEKILGRSSDELERISWPDITHPDDLEADIVMFNKFKKGDIEGYSLNKRFLKPDGSYVWTYMTINHFLDGNNDNPLHLCLLRDITNEKVISDSLNESERSKSILFSNLPGMAYRVIRDNDWQTQFVSSGCFGLTGYSMEQFVVKKEITLGSIIAPEYRKKVSQEWDAALLKKLPFRYEYEIITAQGEKRWVLDTAQAVYNEFGVVEALEGMMLDISERKAAELKLQYTFEHDEETGLLNVGSLHDRMRADDKKPNKPKRGIISVNLSTFQRISMTYGFLYVANLFNKVAQRLNQYSTKNRTLYKSYENRLVYYVKGYKDIQELVDFALKIKEELSDLLKVERVGAGIGILEIENDKPLNINYISKRALMASSKVINLDKTEIGICVFDESLESRVEREELVKQLLTEVANNGGNDALYMVFQPILNLRTKRITSFEALARLKHEKLGMISPLEFIPLAEESKLIIPLGWNIFRQSFTFLKKLEDLGYTKIHVAVNVSAVQMFANNFVKDLIKLIKEMGVNPNKITIELTESVFSNDLNQINNILLQLRAYGIKITIDDFGTGYSSLARERDLKVDSLKIDKYFIDKLMIISKEEAITGDIIKMAHKLGQVVVAEGVEHDKQMQYLIENDCDLIQGYFISKPLEPVAAIDFLIKLNKE